LEKVIFIVAWLASYSCCEMPWSTAFRRDKDRDYRQWGIAADLPHAGSAGG
jgi:hypothetical protein